MSLRNPASTARRLVPERVVDAVRGRQSFFRRWAFHGDRVYQQLVVTLIRELAATHFVETGTYLGDSTRFVAEETPGVEIATCEVDPRMAVRARRRLGRYDRITLVEGSSEQFVARCLADFPQDARPVFFLDAHWYDFWPLPDELRSISSSRLSCAVVIDDFEIPGRPEFLFDSYTANGETRVCGLATLVEALDGDNEYTVYLPRYSPEDAFGGDTSRVLAGHAVVLQNAPGARRLFETGDFLRERYRAAELPTGA
jgi:predicted O-methyltransferase YrrM